MWHLRGKGMRRFNRYLRGMIKVIFRDYKGESILK
jgi:hypothetical protein